MFNANRSFNLYTFTRQYTTNKIFYDVESYDRLNNFYIRGNTDYSTGIIQIQSCKAFILWFNIKTCRNYFMRNVNADLCHSPFIEHDVKFKGTCHNKSFFDKLEDMAHVSYHTQRWQNRIFVACPEYLQYDRHWRADNKIIARNVKI